MSDHLIKDLILLFVIAVLFLGWIFAVPRDRIKRRLRKYVELPGIDEVAPLSDLKGEDIIK